jgi:hypothetical protein
MFEHRLEPPPDVAPPDVAPPDAEVPDEPLELHAASPSRYRQQPVTEISHA